MKKEAPKSFNTNISAKDSPLILMGRILIMDDDEAIRYIGKEALGFIGYSVECAIDGNEAIEIYKKAQKTDNPFDVVILDLYVPAGIGGEYTIKQLREIDPDAKAIVFSGNHNDPILADYKKYGFDAAMTKPFKIDEIREILQNLINR